MKLRLMYVLPILLLVIIVWLLTNRQGNKNILENPQQKTVSANTAGNKGKPIKAAVSNEQSKVPYLAPLYEVNVQNEIVYASKKNETQTEEPLKLDLYEPVGDNTKRKPVFIFIHGGGFTGGSKYDGEAISSQFAKRGYVVLSMDYRLKKNPSADYPRTLNDDYEDITDLIRWINNNAETYGMDAGRLVIGGDSAGGILSINFVNEFLQRDPSVVKSIFGIVDIYGGMLINSVREHFPPTLIIHGTIDQSIPYEQSLKLNDALQKSGIYHDLFTMEGIGHDYKNARYFDEIVQTALHFLWNVGSRQETGGLPEDTTIEAASGDLFDIKLPQAYNRNSAQGQIKVDLPEGWTLDKQESDTALRVHVPIGLDRGNHSIFVSPDQKGEAAPGFAVNVKIFDPFAAKFETYFDAADHKIKTHMQITNRSKTKFSGSLQVDYENENSSSGKFTTNVDLLEPGKSAAFNLPELARGKRVIQAANPAGAVLQKAEDPFNALVIHKSQKPIHIDGNLEEWKDQARFDVNKVVLGGWKGKEDTSATGYVTWDAGNLYLAVDVTDDVHFQDAEGVRIWDGDSVQLAIGLANADGSLPREYHELGLAIDDKGRLSNWRWIAPKGFSVNGPLKKLDYTISRKDQNTVYEMAIPWSELTQHSELAKPGLKMKFSLLVNENDGTGRRGWLEYNSGIGSAKDIYAFGDLFLAD